MVLNDLSLKEKDTNIMTFYQKSDRNPEEGVLKHVI